jgi:hypothetical protein
MKITYHILRIIFGLLLLLQVAGSFGLFPEPTAEMYSTPEAWAFISALMNTGYMMPAIGVISLVCGGLLFMNKTALAAVLLAPFTVNVILFHVFLDESVISAAASPAYLLLAFNLFFLWHERKKYRTLW